MDEARFREAEEAYAAGDHRTAAKLYLAAAGRGSDGNGAAYHKAGNSLMKLHREHDAVTVYAHALRDGSYAERGTVYANLGAAYVLQAMYSEAVEAYSKALEESGYEARHKALQGMAGALWEMGRVEEAARAYRQAALEGTNPDPGKALNNLGLCFLRLGRPDDAVEAFKAALGLDTYANKGRAQANLGLAHAAAGRHEEAVKSFAKAVQLHGHTLSAEAVAVLESSRAVLAASQPEREVVEGWQTGDLAGAAEAGAPRPEGAAPEGAAPTEPTGPFSQVEPLDEFFTRTDDEMRELDREARRSARLAKREERSPWAAAAAIGGGVLLAMALVVAAYFLGFGWPTQRATVGGMMDTYAGGETVDGYWVAVPAGDIAKEMQKVSPSFTSYSVDSVDRSPSVSKVSLTVTPAKGAPMHYVVTLAREGAGWKVTGIENDWRSTGGS